MSFLEGSGCRGQGTAFVSVSLFEERDRGGSGATGPGRGKMVDSGMIGLGCSGHACCGLSTSANQQPLISTAHSIGRSSTNYPLEATLCPDSICCHSAVAEDIVEENPIWFLEIEGCPLAQVALLPSHG
jgi:hypothetical protein